MTEDSNVREQVEYYERHAEKFDRSIWSLGCRDNRNHSVKISSVAGAIRAANGGSVLEVGTGTGLHARWLLENTPVRYTGIDVSEAMLKIARRRLEPFGDRVSLEVADAQKLPFDDGSFDAAFCSTTLHHLSDPRRGIAELVRVVRPGGYAAAIEPNWKFPSVLILSAINKAEHNVFKINGPRLVAWAKAAGLEDVRFRRLLYTPPAPRSWIRFFDAVDRKASTIPGIKQLSITLLVSGRKRENAS